MQTVVKFLFTLFTAVSVFCSNLFFPAVINPESENFEIKNIVFKNISYTSYMKPKIAGTNSKTNTVQVKLDGITICKNEHPIPKLMFNIGKYCEVVSD